MKKILKKLWLKESRETVAAPDHSSSVQQSRDATVPSPAPRHDQDETQTFRHRHNSSPVDAEERSRDGGERHADLPADPAHDLTKVVVNETFDAISPKPQDATGQVVVTPAVFAMQVLPGVIETTDAAANTGTLYQLQVGQTAQGTVGFNGDRDWYAVDLQAGQVYSFAMVGTGSNNVVDPFLRLMGPGGTVELTSDDDSLPGGNSLFTFTPTSAGRYYVVANSFGDVGTGQYGVSVTAGSRPTLDVPMGAGVLDTDSAWTGVPGTGAVVTYAFRNSPAPYTVSGSDISTFAKLTATEMTAVRLALKAWSDVSGISFVEVNPGGYSDNATMLFANYTDPTDGSGAFAFFPGSTAAASQAGDVWLNTGSITTTALIDYGSYAFNAIVHEIGHALGLSHPGLYNAAPGVSITYGANAQFTQDTNQFTVMSYFDEANTGAQFFGYPESPMLFDVYAIQQIYGANFTTRTGDSVYGFNANTGAPFDFSTNLSAAFTIWDAGGTDTLDASGYSSNQIIDLNPGAFSSIGNLTNNIAIAIGALIENAIGGFGNDTITGNAANNTLSGGAGADVISGADGNDILNGGAGNDTLLIGRGQDTATGGADLDTFQLDLVADIGPQGALITDLALGEAISWSAFQTSLVSGLPVTLVGPIVAGSGTATTLNHIEYAAQANTTVLYFGLDTTPGADFTVSITGLLGLSQFTIEQNNASGALLRVQALTTAYSVSPSAASVSEGGGSLTFTVTRAGETPAETLFVSTTTGEGSSNAGDFTALSDQAITFAAGELTKTVTVAITNDTVFETTETFGLVVQRNTTDADTTFLAKSTFTILDDDPQPVTYSMTPATTSVSEGVGTISFTVSRSSGAAAETLFASTTTGEGFANNADFTALADQAIAFAAGELTKTVTVAITNDTVVESTETFGLVVQRSSTDLDTTFLAKSTFTILDNDTSGPDVTPPNLISTSPADDTTNVPVGANIVLTFDEAVKAGTGNLRLVNLTTGASTLFAVTDTRQVSFSGNTLTLNPVGDLLPGNDYELRIPLAGIIKDLAGNNFAPLANPINFTTNNGTTPTTTYALSPGVASVNEAAGTISFSITRSGGTPAESVFVSTTTTEGFANNADFTALTDQVITFAAGETVKLVTVAITNDTVFEATETFGLVVQRNATDADTTFLAKSTFSIVDDDPLPTTYALTPATTSVNEAAGTVTFTITRSGGTPAETLFASTTTGEGSANAGDFTAIADQAITFLAGELTKTVTVAITNDTLFEATETFGLVIQRNSTDADTTFLAKSTFSILDDDPAIPTTYALTPVTTSVSEGVGTVTFTITRSGGNPAETIFASTTTGEGSANAGDFAAIADQAITFAAGELTKTVTVAITNDAVFEATETFGLVVQRNATDADTTFLAKSTFTILDDDPQPTTYALTPGTTSVNEAAGTVTFTITRSGGTAAETIFASTTTGEGSANNADFTALADQAITFAAGELTKTVTVAITNDTVFETTETFGLVVQRNTTDADTTFLAKSTFTILDDDPQPVTYSMSPATTSVSEGVGTISFTVSRSSGAAAETLFASTTTGEGFANNADFTALADQAISFAVGETTKTITVSVTNDTIVESTETFGLVVQRSSTDLDTTFLAKSTFTILDNDTSGPDVTPPNLISTSPADDTTNVPVGANIVLTFDEAVKAGTGNLRLVNLTTGASTLFAVTDTRQVSFSGNTLTLNPVGDLLPGNDYELRIPLAGIIKDLAGNNFAPLANPINFTTNNGTTPTTTYALSPGVASVNEAAGTISFSITRSGGTPAESVFVSTTTTEGFANNADFTALTDQVITFAAGETVKLVTVAITNDTVFEATETFGLVVQRNATDADTTFLAKSTFSIVDDDPLPTTYALTPATTSVNEAAGTVTFTITRSGGTPAETLFASTTTGEGSANAGDFTAIADQAITFLAGELTKTVTVAITNDTLFEATETFGLVIQRNSTDADTTFLAKSTFSILDDDPAIPTTYALTPVTTSVSEGVGTVTFTITRSGGNPAETIFASTTTGEGSANAGDFAAIADQAITFAAGELTKTVTVAITNDAVFEATETFGLVVQRNATDADTTFLAKSTFTILDDDPQPTTYALTPGTTSVNEAAGTVTFTITRSGGTAAETIFASTTTGEGSANNADFTALADQAITFAAGELTKTVTVAITNDTVFETTETFGLVVQRNTTDADTTFLAKSTFTILDDDPQPVTYSMSPATTSVSEGVGTISFTVSRSSGAAAETLFASTTTGEGFANNADFTALADQAISFAVGETTKTITVSVTNDTIVESTETFGLVVQRSSTDLDTTFLAKSTFTILDNDTSGPDVTPPNLISTSPADDTTNVPVGANIVLTFDEAVKAGTGNLRLVNLTTGASTLFAVTDTRQVSFSGNTLTLNPVGDLLPGNDYELRIPLAGIIKDLAGNNFAPLANPINFTTGIVAIPSSASAQSTLSGTAGNDVLVGTAGDNILMGGLGIDTFVWTTTNGLGDGLGTDLIDATAGERLDFDLSLLQTLKLSNGGALLDGGSILSGPLHGGGMASLALTDPSTLAFDWNGDGVADLTLKFTAAPHLLTYDALHGDILVG